MRVLQRDTVNNEPVIKDFTLERYVLCGFDKELCHRSCAFFSLNTFSAKEPVIVSCTRANVAIGELMEEED